LQVIVLVPVSTSLPPLDASAPNLIPECDPSTSSQIIGVIGIERVDLLLKNIPTDCYHDFVEDAFGTSMSTEARALYDDANIAKYVFPLSGTTDKLH